MNRNIVLKEFEEAQIAKLTNEKKISNFFPGDTVSVKLKIGDRFSLYEGVCIAKKNRGLNSAFTLRKISYGEGTERNFPFYSPNITEINLVRRGRVKRAKLYYLRALRGKNSRIKDSTTGYKMKLDTK